MADPLPETNSASWGGGWNRQRSDRQRHRRRSLKDDSNKTLASHGYMDPELSRCIFLFEQWGSCSSYVAMLNNTKADIYPFFHIIMVQWTLASHFFANGKSYIQFRGVVTHTSASSTINSTGALSPIIMVQWKITLKGNCNWRDPFVNSMIMGGRVLCKWQNHTCHTVWHEVVPWDMSYMKYHLKWLDTHRSDYQL